MQKEQDTLLRIAALEKENSQLRQQVVQVDQASHRLEIQNKLVDDLLEYIQPINFKFDIEQMRIVDLDDSLCDLTGYSRSELLTRNPLDILHPDIHDQFLSLIKGYSTDSYVSKIIDYKFFPKGEEKQWITCKLRTIKREGKYFYSAILPVDGDALARFKISLQRKNQQLRSTIANIPGMVYRIEANWKLKIFGGSESFFGYTDQEINELPNKWLDIIHPGDHEQFYIDGLEQLKNPVSNVKVYRIITKKKTTIWVEDHRVSAFSQEGVFVGLDGILYDISGRRMMEKSLAESEHKYRSIFKSINDLVVYVDTKGRFIDANDRFLKVLGFSRDELVGKNVAVLGFSKIKSFSKVMSLFKQVVTSGVLSTGPTPEQSLIELEIQDKNKKIRLFEINTSHLKDKEDVIGFVSIMRDITDQRQAVLKLMALDEAFQHAGEGMVLINMLGEIEYANPAWAQLHNVTLDDIIGSDSDQFFSSKESSGEFCPLQQEAIQDGQSAGECIQYRSDGSSFTSSINISKYCNSQGDTIGFLIVSRDISDRIESDNRLRQNQKLESLGRMIGGIAHDFNNILQSIFLTGELLLEDVKGTENLDAVKQIMSQGKRAKDIIRQILIFSRKDRVEFKAHYIQNIIAEVLPVVRSTLPANIFIQDQIDINCEPVNCDRTQIFQVIINLCNNANYAMGSRPGTLGVSLNPGTKDEAQFVVLKIADTGVGMTPEIQQMIFDPFYTTKSVDDGTGLGLSVVYGIVHNSGGEIKLESKTGEGSTFKILLPITQVAVEQKEDLPIQPVEFRHRILLVDDEEAIRTAGKTILERRGFKVDVAIDGEAAMAIIKQSAVDYDLVITDLTMPGISGVDLAKLIFLEKTDLPIILSSGFLQDTEIDNYLKQGISGFIQKPWTAEQLYEKINELNLFS